MYGYFYIIQIYDERQVIDEINTGKKMFLTEGDSIKKNSIKSKTVCKSNVNKFIIT